MVACVHAVVDDAFIWLKVVGAHHVVNAETESLAVEGNAKAESRLHEAVGEATRHGVTGIGYGSVVEVATGYYGVLAVVFNVLVNSFYLLCTYLHG